MTYVISEPCVDVKDKTCLEVCPVDCIYEGDRILYIHPDECIDCSACEPVCPVEAIYPLDGLPDQWTEYARINAEFFTNTTSIGNPGGSTKIDPPGVDHEHIAALPRRAPSRDAPPLST